jgi:phosphatidylglycerol:prolipoprotein diacylglycerol transferase
MYTVEMFGLTFDLDPVAFSIGSYDIYWYGIIIATGFLAALIYGFRRAKEYRIPTDPMIDVIIAGALGAIVGARLYYVLTSDNTTIKDFLDIRSGGLAIYGAIIGAFLCGGLACKWKKINIFDMFDLAAPAFLIGQSIGRWGNFMNQEAFGAKTTLPWGMYSNGTASYLFRNQSTLQAQGITVDPSMPVHPCFLYESLWCILGFLILYILSKHRRFKGETALQYIIWYSLGRFFIESVRTDSLMIGQFKISQLLAALCVIAGNVVLICLSVKANKNNEPNPLANENSVLS